VRSPTSTLFLARKRQDAGSPRWLHGEDRPLHSELGIDRRRGLEKGPLAVTLPKGIGGAREEPSDVIVRPDPLRLGELLPVTQFVRQQRNRPGRPGTSRLDAIQNTRASTPTATLWSTHVRASIERQEN
jgi:hypothetical protein